VDDIAGSVLPTGKPVLRVGHSKRAEVGHSCRAPRGMSVDGNAANCVRAYAARFPASPDRAPLYPAGMSGNVGSMMCRSISSLSLREAKSAAYREATSHCGEKTTGARILESFGMHSRGPGGAKRSSVFKSGINATLPVAAKATSCRALESCRSRRDRCTSNMREALHRPQARSSSGATRLSN